jgi:hypothetical protein
MRSCFLALAVTVLGFVPSSVIACECVPTPPGVKTARDFAKWNADRSDVIFEGTVDRIEVNWTVRDAKVGDLMPANLDEPYILVSFADSHFYRGTAAKNMTVRTGLGLGDCGFPFEAGKQYLVFASREKSGEITTSICSGTALYGRSQANLAYLRGEPVPEVSGGSRAIPGGKVCGTVVREGTDFTDAQLLFIPAEAKYAIPHGEAELDDKGSFCATDLAPGQYQLLFMDGSESALTSFLFFPGVIDRSEATTIAIKSGQVVSDLVFRAPTQAKFSVSGAVHLPANSRMPSDYKVALFGAEPSSFMLVYAVQGIEPGRQFVFPGVLPGKYWALVLVDSEDAPTWLTRKTEFTVTGAITGLSLELTLPVQ